MCTTPILSDFYLPKVAFQNSSDSACNFKQNKCLINLQLRLVRASQNDHFVFIIYLSFCLSLSWFLHKDNRSLF